MVVFVGYALAFGVVVGWMIIESGWRKIRAVFLGSMEIFLAKYNLV